jgi:hypothetical protein
MANTFTTNYSLVKSEIGGDNQNWGTNIHNTITAVDSQLVNKLDTEIAKVQTSTVISFTASGRIITAASGNLFEDFKSGDKIKISGASSGGNNGTHVIASKTNQNTIVITAASTLADESAGQTISYNLVFEPATIDAGVTTVDSLTVEGNTTLGDANTDTVTFTGKVATDILPSADGSYDLGGTGAEWQDLHIDGTANIDALVADGTYALSGSGTIAGCSSLTLTGTTISMSGYTIGSNAEGVRTVGTSAPSSSDGANGDIHYEY